MIRLSLILSFLLACSGCIAAAAGAGAEAAYLTTQEDRSPGETFDDQRITAELKSKLLADPDVSGLAINVDTFKSVVTMRGFVNSQKEADKALALAKTVPGVKDIQANLVLK